MRSIVGFIILIITLGVIGIAGYSAYDDYRRANDKDRVALYDKDGKRYTMSSVSEEDEYRIESYEVELISESQEIRREAKRAKLLMDIAEREYKLVIADINETQNNKDYILYVFSEAKADYEMAKKNIKDHDATVTRTICNSVAYPYLLIIGVLCIAMMVNIKFTGRNN